MKKQCYDCKMKKNMVAFSPSCSLKAVCGLKLIYKRSYFKLINILYWSVFLIDKYDILS